MDSKRYYWYKLQENFLHNDIIEFLIRQPNGFQYFSLFIYLLDLTKNTNGVLKKVLTGYDGKILSVEKLDAETISNKLSNIFNLDTVRCGLEMLKFVGLLCTNGDGYLYIFDFDSFVGSETESAKKRREARAKAKDPEEEPISETTELQSRSSALLNDEPNVDVDSDSEPQEQVTTDESEKPLEDCTAKKSVHKYYSKTVESLYRQFVIKSLAYERSGYSKRIDKATVDWLLKLAYKLSSVGFIQVDSRNVSTVDILETLYTVFNKRPDFVKSISHFTDIALEKGQKGFEDGIENTFEAIVAFVYVYAIRLLKACGVKR